MLIGLIIILIIVLTAPFLIKQVECNLEPFLLVMGVLAAACSGKLGLSLLASILSNPLLYLISLAVLVSGLLFVFLQAHFQKAINFLMLRIPFKVFIFLMIVILGLFSSVITAIVASLILVEVVSVLQLQRSDEVRLCIIACFAIGLGAVLTPVGEPLSTIVTSRLQHGFWYLLHQLGALVIPGIIALGLIGSLLVKNDPAADAADSLEQTSQEDYQAVGITAAKVFIFVFALELLGTGFKPMIDTYVISLSSGILYWINMISAVMDNATLAATEVSIRMSSTQIASVLMGLLISGGMLIPGNIPNIITAGRLKITSSEWARLGVPLGLSIMLVYFFVLMVV